MPYISDVVAHVFWYSQHMATVHYLDGKFHVHTEVMEAATKTNNDKDQTPFSEKKEQHQNVHLISSVATIDAPSRSIEIKYLRTSSIIFSGHLQNDYPPPKS
ncbi:MAG: hypothetical protein ABIP30_01585 [Ferruginibacter sp.]